MGTLHNMAFKAEEEKEGEGGEGEEEASSKENKQGGNRNCGSESGGQWVCVTLIRDQI